MNLKQKKPKVALLESIRSIGYDFNSALADIVDNSISAKAKNIHINLIPSIPAIAIIDDGEGMDEEELDSAMDLGSKNPNDVRRADDLGRFGMGLKSASFSQCRNLTTTSLKNGQIRSMTWDLQV
ncbi:MAG TPA: ATP-binding protein, partial [Firmicutes bacterium]|nr:ATP-binding protein [Bacillota bacterium]